MKYASVPFLGFFLIAFLTMCQSTPSSNTDGAFDEMIGKQQYIEAYEYMNAHPEAKLSNASLFELGKFYNERTLFDESGEIFRSLLAQEPDNSIAKLLLANNYRETKAYNASLKLYNELVVYDSLKIFVLPERARLYIMLNDFDKATMDLDDAKSIEPQYFAIFLADGLLKYAEGNNGVALDLFEKAESLDPGVSSEASLYSGVILLNLGVNLDAMEKFSTAISVGRNVNLGYAYINRGICQLNLTDTAFACEDWLEAKKYMPEQAENYLGQFCNSGVE